VKSIYLVVLIVHNFMDSQKGWITPSTL